MTVKNKVWYEVRNTVGVWTFNTLEEAQAHIDDMSKGFPKFRPGMHQDDRVYWVTRALDAVIYQIEHTERALTDNI